MQFPPILQVKTQQEHSELSELMGDFGLESAKGKGIAADHAIEQQFAQSEHDLKQAEERVTAVNDAIRELQHLENFISSTKPPTEEAVMLTEEIVRQLLEKLNFLRLDFPVKSAPKPVRAHLTSCSQATCHVSPLCCDMCIKPQSAQQNQHAVKSVLQLAPKF